MGIRTGGITNYDRLWHYDGTVWKSYDKQIIGTFPNCLFGFSKDDVWLGGNDGKIWHFNGNAWIQSFMYHTDPGHVDIMDISGQSPTNIYAVGVSNINSSFILHFDGTNWNEELFTNSNSQFLYLRQDNDRTFISCLKPNLEGTDTIVLYQYKNKQLIELFSKPLSEITFASMNKIGDEVYFLLGQDLNRNINGKFIKVVSFSETNFGYNVYGRNLKDIFIIERDGLAHYNGENVEYLYQFANNFTSLYKPLIFDNEVFFAVHDYPDDLNLVLHGKLKE